MCCKIRERAHGKTDNISYFYATALQHLECNEKESGKVNQGKQNKARHYNYQNVLSVFSITIVSSDLLKQPKAALGTFMGNTGLPLKIFQHPMSLAVNMACQMHEKVSQYMSKMPECYTILS